MTDWKCKLGNLRTRLNLIDHDEYILEVYGYMRSPQLGTDSYDLIGADEVSNRLDA